MQFYSLAGSLILPLLFLVLADAGFVPNWLQMQIVGLIALGGPISLIFFLLVFFALGAKIGQKVYLFKTRHQSKQ